MSAIQLSFSLRVSSGVKTVHLLGSWDNYSGQLPLSKDKSSSKGTWKGTFRFQQATLQPGQRYWYYYIIDGYHVSHNPSEDSTVEPTTGRALNILDVPKAKSSSSSSSSKSSSRKSTSSSKSRSSTSDIAKGRPLSISQIKAPKPVSPNATRHILDNDFDEEELSSRFAATGIYEDEYYNEDVITDFSAPGSPVSSVGSSLSYRSDTSGSSGYSTPASDCSSCTCERYGITRKGERDEEELSSRFAATGIYEDEYYNEDVITDFGAPGSPVSSTGSSLSYRSDTSGSSGYSTPASDCSSCTCERYGITRKGERVRLDCGGSRCSYDDSCSSEDEAEYVERSSRRNGIVVRD